MCVVPVVVDPPQRATRVIPVKKCVCKLYGRFRNFFCHRTLYTMISETKYNNIYFILAVPHFYTHGRFIKLEAGVGRSR